MVDNDNPLQPVSPAEVLNRIAAAVPEDCRDRIIVIGSLAVGYYYFGDRAEMVVRTKDADCLLSPREKAVGVGSAITEKLRAAGWKPMEMGPRGTPGNENTPDEELPAIRLRPPGDSG